MSILTIDTETRGLNAEAFVCGSICNEKLECISFVDREDMAKYIFEFIHKEAIRGNKTRIYAHNMEYDFFTVFLNHKDKFKYFNTSRPFIAMWECCGTKRNRDGTIKCNVKDYYGNFHSTTDIFPVALAEVGKSMGFEKTETPEILKTSEGEIDFAMMGRIREYCERDTRIVMLALQKLREDTEKKFGMKMKRILTKGQIAISTYATWARRNYSKIDPTRTYWSYISRYNNELERSEIYPTSYEKEVRKAYRGGMNIAFQTGEFGNISMIDVNSLYGYILSTMKFPLLQRETFILSGKDYLEFEKEIGFARARVRTKMGCSGILGIWHDNMLMFPNKDNIEMESIWSIHELAIAKDNGYEIIDIEWYILYPDLETNPFTEYIQLVYKHKIEAKDGFEKNMSKLRINALSGKFGQRTNRMNIEFCHRREGVEKSREGWEIIGVPAMGDCYAIGKPVKDDDYKPYFVNPAIIALVTAEARIFLWKEMQKINRKDIIYCDTDSIMMKNFDKYRDKMNIGSGLGQWKIEFENENVMIKGEKRYMTDTKIKLAGVSGRFKTKENFEKGEFMHDRMIGLSDELKGVGIAGTFKDKKFSMKKGSKKDRELPERIVDL